MKITIVNLIPRNYNFIRDVNGPWADYKYTFQVEDAQYSGGWVNGINHIADEIMLNPIKVQKQMEKFGGLNHKERIHEYITREYTFTYFKTEEEALQAKEWIESMFLNVQMVGKAELRQQQKEKSIENKTKKIQKHLSLFTPFKGEQVTITITTVAGIFTIDDTIVDITLYNTHIEMNFNKGRLRALYSHFKLHENIIYCDDYKITIKGD